MQLITTSRLTSGIVAFSLLLSAFPSQAQYAYTSVAPAKEVILGADPVDGTKDRAYKKIHGVIQGSKGALPGATIWLHGSQTVVVTNAEGEFELRVPATATKVSLTCAYGGLQDEVVTLAPSEALGSVYLLRAKTANAAIPAGE